MFGHASLVPRFLFHLTIEAPKIAVDLPPPSFVVSECTRRRFAVYALVVDT